jgi:hypothetical protein
MAPRIHVEPATLEHALALAPRMRADDAAEVCASHDMTPLEALRSGLERSQPHAWAGFIDGELAAMFGLSRAPFLATSVCPWLLTSDVVERHPRAFWIACREVVRQWVTTHHELEQWVDARYTRALRWARRLGFQVEPAEPFGAHGLPFHRIHMRRA